MSLFLILTLIAVYLLGVAVAWQKIKGWKNPWYEKAEFIVLWPITLILYGIYTINKKS